MAKKKKQEDPRIALVSLYKKYLTTHGELPSSIKELMKFGEMDFIDFKKQFKSLEELEIALVLWYFKQANDLLLKDKQATEWEPKDRHIAFLYLLIEHAAQDEFFLTEFVQHKKRSGSFMTKFMMVLNGQHFEVLESEGKLTEVFDRINLNPKKAVLTNHAISVLMFFLKDDSADKQDTDAFIEKTSDLIFRLTDTSTLTSIFDLGKFMVSRKNEVFTWD